MSRQHPKPSNQTGQNPVSAATVKSVRLNAAEKGLVRKDERTKRKEYLKSLEADAQTFLKGFQTAKAINEEANVLHRKFKDVVEEMRPVFERVRYGFAHLKKGETVMGERTGTVWAERYIGISYDWLCRCLNPPRAGTLLLTDGTKVLAASAANTDCNRTEGKTSLPMLKEPLPQTPTGDTVELAAEDLLPETSTPTTEEDKKPLVAISYTSFENSETGAKAIAVRRILSWTLECIHHFSLIEKRQIVEELIVKLRDEMEFEATNLKKSASSGF
jgi:hypothetical protein